MSLLGLATVEDLKQVEHSLDMRTRELRRVEDRLAHLEKVVAKLGGPASLAERIAERTGADPETVEAILKAAEEENQ